MSRPERTSQLLLLAGLLWLSWLVMTAVHEAGHVIGAVITGGTVRRVVWHPAVLSRTEVDPNPRPLIEIWAGPLIGSLLPLAIAGSMAIVRPKAAYLAWFFAGFCLIANGAYLGVGAFDAVGDARELRRLGVPAGVLGAFGSVLVPAGFAIWHAVSTKFGFGREPLPIRRRHVRGVVAAALLVTIAGLVIDARG